MSDISQWDPAAANNNATPPDGWPENMARNNVNNSARENMAATRRWYEDVEWRDYGDTPAQTGATTFTVTGDQTANYLVGRAIRATDSSTLYGIITASSFSSVTTVTVELVSGSLSGSLSAVALGSSPAKMALSGQTIRWIKGADVASAAALDFNASDGALDGNYFDRDWETPTH